MVLGEGAGAVILESLQSARQRGVPILAEIVGSGSSAVSSRRQVADCRKALSIAMRRTMQDAQLTADQVGHVHAHGLSTRHMDQMEAEAIAEVFAGRKSPVPVVAAKSYFGNTGAASGLLELIASVLAQQHDQLFPVLNYQTADPACPVHAVTADDTPPGDTFLNCSVTPQGQASVIAVRRFAG
jgi:3-oxoacyl-[acyl-carrier-protein] synthase II